MKEFGDIQNFNFFSFIVNDIYLIKIFIKKNSKKYEIIQLKFTDPFKEEITERIFQKLISRNVIKQRNTSKKVTVSVKKQIKIKFEFI